MRCHKPMRCHISIHALREESDYLQGTSPAHTHGISIHALREESDKTAYKATAYLCNFNPRSP